MTEAIPFALFSGFFFGFFVGICFAANATAKAEKKETRNGIMERDGVVYRITRIDP